MQEEKDGLRNVMLPFMPELERALVQRRLTLASTPFSLFAARSFPDLFSMDFTPQRGSEDGG